jgi:hypothetical protein
LFLQELLLNVLAKSSLINACMDLKINEISSYDRNGFARGERIMQAFEMAISRRGFLPRS